MQQWLFAQSGELGYPNRMFDPETVFVLAAAGAVAIGLVGYFLKGYLVRKAELNLAMRQSEMAADLKAGMIERGFSAAEIERVLAAKEGSTAGPDV